MAVTIKQNEEQLSISINGDTIIINNCCNEELRQAILDETQRKALQLTSAKDPQV